MTRDTASKLKDYAFWLLAKREWSVVQLREKLEDKCEKMRSGHDRVNAVVEEFVEQGWVSDERFAQSFIRDQISKQNGPIKIKFNARKYGLDAELLDNKLEELYS